MSKQINSRIQIKQDTSTNWHIASENNFKPLKGEFICYTDLAPMRLKLGDGIHTPDELDWYDKTIGELNGVKKNDVAQTVYITNPQGEQSHKRYTSEAYPSTIVHRENSLNTFAVGDPVFNAHPVTMRFANERYFPLQKTNELTIYKTLYFGQLGIEDMQDGWDSDMNISTMIDKWVAENLQQGQKLFTSLDAVNNFNMSNIISIIPDPSEPEIAKAKNVICTNFSTYDENNNPITYNRSPYLTVAVRDGEDIYKYYIYRTNSGWNLKDLDVNYWRRLQSGKIDFYDVADYTEHVKEAILIQNASGNPSYLKYSYGPNSAKEVDNNDYSKFAGSVVRFTSANGRFNVMDPTSSLHPVNKRTMEKYVRENAPKQEHMQSDWGEGDTSADSFIKNRTHHIEFSRDYFKWENIILGNQIVIGLGLVFYTGETDNQGLYINQWFKPGKYVLQTMQGEYTDIVTENAKNLFNNTLRASNSDDLLIEVTDNLGSPVVLYYYPIENIKQLDANYLPIDNDTITIFNGKLKANIPADVNTTYSLSKDGNIITLTGSDGKKTSVTDNSGVQADWNQNDKNAADYINNKPPIQNGAGSKSMVINEGDANAQFSIAGGTTSKDLVQNLTGVDPDSLTDITITKAKAYGVMSLSFGANTNALSHGSISLGFGDTAGAKGYYVVKYINSNNLAIAASRVGLNGATDITSLDWQVGDLITVSTNDKVYPLCAQIAAIDTSYSYKVLPIVGPTVNCVKITLDRALPFTSIDAAPNTPNDNGIFAVRENYRYNTDGKLIKPDGSEIGLLDYKYKAMPRYTMLSGEITLGFGAKAAGVLNLSAGQFANADGLANTILGDYGRVGGRYNTAGHNADVIGTMNAGLGIDSHTEGWLNENYANNSHVEGSKNVLESTAPSGHVEGYKNTVSGEAGHGEGEYNIVSGNYAHGEGYETETMGDGAHTGGCRTTTFGNYSFGHGKSTNTFKSAVEQYNAKYGTTHNYKNMSSDETARAIQKEFPFLLAKGNSTTAFGIDTLSTWGGSFATGNMTYAGGRASFASGDNTESLGTGSATFGIGTKITSDGGLAIGRYNSDAKAALVIGKGDKSDTTVYAKDIFKVDWDGIVTAGGLNISKTYKDSMGETGAFELKNSESTFICSSGVKQYNFCSLEFNNGVTLVHNYDGDHRISTLKLDQDKMSFNVKGDEYNNTFAIGATLTFNGSEVITMAKLIELGLVS